MIYIYLSELIHFCFFFPQSVLIKSTQPTLTMIPIFSVKSLKDTTAMTGLLPKVQVAKSPEILPNKDTVEGEIKVIPTSIIHQDCIRQGGKITPRLRVTPLGHTHLHLHSKSTITL